MKDKEKVDYLNGLKNIIIGILIKQLKQIYLLY